MAKSIWMLPSPKPGIRRRRHHTRHLPRVRRESVAAQIAALHQQATSTSTPNSSALVPVNRGGGKTDTVVLAQRIIKNAFNFLASFSGNLDGGVEVVPLKAFEEWWRKFEGKVRSDPGFLERDGD